MRVLVIRLSSLGDILLSLSFLETLPEGATVDWIVASDFAFVLEGHPKIRRVIPFQKKLGSKAWIDLILSLRNDSYQARVDLHRTLRSRVAMNLFRIFDLLSFRWIPSFSISKERIKTSLYLLFKEALPGVLRPTPYWKRFARLALQVSKNVSPRQKESPPSYLPVLNHAKIDETEVLKKYSLTSKQFYGVMPSSRWRSKEWGAVSYFDLIVQLKTKGLIPVLLGRESDFASQDLKLILDKEKIPYRSALKEMDFKKTAILLKHARFYIGSDTGLSHLAEAVGTESHVIFGPTRPGLGFGPWRKESSGISIPLVCAPCSKDGKNCYRFFDQYACLKKLPVDQVRKSLP